MFTNLFLGRDRKFTSLIKLGKSLGRSLRENVELFSVDDDSVIYLTESGHIIRGSYNYGKDVTLQDIEVETSEVLTDKNKFNTFVDARASKWLTGLFHGDLNEANNGWDTLLKSWEHKLMFNFYREKLTEKAEKIFRTSGLVRTDEFQKILELTPNLVEFLKENKEQVLKIKELSNAVRLSKTISEAFSFPRITIEDLKNSEFYRLTESVSASLFDIICSREMMAQELLETKESFDTVWATSEKVTELAAFVSSKDKDAIFQKLAECIKEIPYFALATKKQLSSLLRNTLSLAENSITQNEIQKFVALLFEAKKPVKKALLDILNEKYDLNVYTLKDPVSFRSLVDTQVVIFEALAKVTPKKSALRENINNFVEILKEKSGIESLDVMDYLAEVFTEAGLDTLLTESYLHKYLDFERVADDLGQISQVLKMIKATAGGGEMGGQPGMGDPSMAGGAPGGMPGQAPQPGAGMMPGEEQFPSDETVLDGETEEEEGGTPAMSPEMAAQGATGEMGMGQPGMEDPTAVEEDPLETSPMMGQGDLVGQLSKLEKLIADLSDEISGAADMAGEESGEGEFPDAESEGDELDLDTGEGDDDVHIDVDSHGGEDDPESEEAMFDAEEEDDEEEAPPKKEKPFPKKKKE